MRKIRRTLTYIALTALVCSAALVAAIGLLNAVDEELSPDVVALVKRVEAEQIAQEGNSYFAVRGLLASPGQDIEAVGRVLYEADQRHIEAANRGGEPRYARAATSAGALKFEGESSNLCSVIEDWQYDHGVCKYQVETDQMFRDNGELLRRYYRLLTYRTYEEPAQTDHFFWNPVIISLTRMANVDIERRLDRKEVAEAAELMVQNLAFWRGAMNGKYRLLSGELIRVGYNLSFFTLSELLWRHPALLKHANFDQALGEPMNSNPNSMGAQLDREFTKIYRVREGSDLLFLDQHGDTDVGLKWLANRLYRRNATLNAYLGCLEKFFAVRQQSGAAYEQALSEYRNYEIDWGADSVVNLTGKLVLSRICPERSWAGASYNLLESRRRLVLLQIRLLSSNLPISKYPAVLESAGTDLHDPVTGRPAIWDAVQNVVYFERDNGCIGDRLWVRLGLGRQTVRCPSQNSRKSHERDSQLFAPSQSKWDQCNVPTHYPAGSSST